MIIEVLFKNRSESTLVIFWNSQQLNKFKVLHFFIFISNRSSTQLNDSSLLSPVNGAYDSKNGYGGRGWGLEFTVPLASCTFLRGWKKSFKNFKVFFFHCCRCTIDVPDIFIRYSLPFSPNTLNRFCCVTSKTV